MILRCPSCGAQVDEDAKQCLKCGWDFAQFKKLPLPDNAAPQAAPAEAAEKAPSLDNTAPNFAIPSLGKLSDQPPAASAEKKTVIAPNLPSSGLMARLPKIPKTAPPSRKPAAAAQVSDAAPQPAASDAPSGASQGARWVNRLTAGAIIAGIIFVALTYLMLRPEDNAAGRPGARPVFPKNLQPQTLRLPAVIQVDEPQPKAAGQPPTAPR